MASKPWFTTCATGEDEETRAMSVTRPVSFRADAGDRNVSRDRAGRGSSGRTRESATRRRGEEDAFSGGIRRGRTRGAAGASAFARGKALKMTAPGWTLSGKSGVGGETRGSAGIERGGGGAHLLADESTRDDDGHVHAGALFEEGKMGERRHEVSRRGWSLVETMCGRRTQGGGGATANVPRRASPEGVHAPTWSPCRKPRT